MKTINHLKYTRSHEWVEFKEGDIARIGITDYAQDKLGSLVFINLPMEGDELEEGESFCDVESVKSVSDVNAPVSGTVSAVNEALLDEPGTINDSPYDAWFVEVEGVSVTNQEEFLTAQEYEEFCAEEE